MIGVFLDFRKAYETITHSILLKKLYKYGIRGHILNWFNNNNNNNSLFQTFVHIRNINIIIRNTYIQ